MKEKYVSPDFTEESTFEVNARACQKIPGLGDQNFCGQVWLGKNGFNKDGCHANPSTKSS